MDKKSDRKEEVKEVIVRKCELCGKKREVEEVPLHGYSKWMCKRCAEAAYSFGAAI